MLLYQPVGSASKGLDGDRDQEVYRSVAQVATRDSEVPERLTRQQ